MSDIKVSLFHRGVAIQQVVLPLGSSILVGRKGHGADLEVDNTTISRKQFKLSYHNSLLVHDLNSTNGTFVNGVKIQPNVDLALKMEDIIAFNPGMEYTVKMSYVTAQRPVHSFRKTLAQHLTSTNKIKIGRNPQECDIVLEERSVSRVHAAVYKEGNNYYIEDLNSTNGTFVNGLRIHGKTKISKEDKILIGLALFKLDEVSRDLTEESAIRAINIEKNYNRGKVTSKFVGLREMTIDIPKNKFVALMGPSGCGKSTLLKALNGDNPADKGTVLIHGLDLVENYEFIKRKIGYVPQDDIVHRDLSVYDSLYFAAKLRMGDNVSDEIIEAKITEALSNLNINNPEIRKKKVKELSGGQRKRVSIAVELLNSPTILFLDEPTSPLDPETIEEFLKCIQELTKQGTTVVMVTHKPEDLNYVDKVIFLGTDGYYVYYGEKGSDFLNYFNKKDIIGVYSLMSRSNTSEDWYKKWKHNSGNLNATQGKPTIRKKNESLVRQLYWLIARYSKLKWNDSVNVILLAAQPIIIAGLLCIVFNTFNQGVLFLMAITSVWFGVSNAAKEIVSEIPIYRRERLFNLNIHTYLFSKITVLSFISLAQLIVFVGIVYLRYSGIQEEVDGVMYNAGMGAYLPNLFFLTWIAISSTLVGLLLSVWFDNAEKVMTVVPIALIPQIMLAGVVAPIKNTTIELFSYFSLGRWGIEGLAKLQDIYGDGFFITTDQPLLGVTKKRVGAVDSLLLYKDDLLCWFQYDDGLHMVMAVTLATNVVVYAIIYFLLKKKDSI
jgi:ABC-type multidrug transport system ATPase subunit